MLEILIRRISSNKNCWGLEPQLFVSSLKINNRSAWYTKKDFYGIRNLYNKGLTHQDFNGYGVEHVTESNKDYFKYYEDLENQWRDGLLNHEE